MRFINPLCTRIFRSGSIGIEVFPAYYEKYLRESYPDDYLPPNEAFRRIGQTLDFPEMSRLLRQVWEYKGEGIPAKLFYEGKVAEAVSLVYEHGKKSKSELSAKYIQAGQGCLV